MAVEGGAHAEEETAQRTFHSEHVQGVCGLLYRELHELVCMGIFKHEEVLTEVFQDFVGEFTRFDPEMPVAAFAQLLRGNGFPKLRDGTVEAWIRKSASPPKDDITRALVVSAKALRHHLDKKEWPHAENLQRIQNPFAALPVLTPRVPEFEPEKVTIA